MIPKQINNIPDGIFSLYQKGVQAFKLNNIDYAIELLKTAVVKEPGFIEARKQLRLYELAKEKPGLMKKTLIGIKLNKCIKVAQMKNALKKYNEAYANIEDALAISIYTHSGLKLLAEIGEGLEAPFIVIEAFDLAVQIFPVNFDILSLAADKYRKYNQAAKELETRKKIVNLKPDDLKLRMEMREASALATMEKSDWENKEKAFTEKLKDKKESASLEADDRIVKREDEAAELIAKLEDELKNNPSSITAIRELGDIYFNTENYDKAIEKFTDLMTIRNVFDLTIDSKIEKAKIKKLEKNIITLENEKQNFPEKSEDIESQILEIKTEILNIRKTSVIKRIEQFPNDMQLRFAYGKVCWDEKNIDAAIEQFQLSQANLNKQIPSLLYLGKCFMLKKQYDIATEQFIKVLEDPKTPTEQQLEALYYLGISYEKLGNNENAGKCFKKIYSAKSTYKDIAEIIKKYY